MARYHIVFKQMNIILNARLLRSRRISPTPFISTFLDFIDYYSMAPLTLPVGFFNFRKKIENKLAFCLIGVIVHPINNGQSLIGGPVSCLKESTICQSGILKSGTMRIF
jgi:hypothetical protein